MAAGKTVPEGLHVHSMHCYFLLAGDKSFNSFLINCSQCSPKEGYIRSGDGPRILGIFY